MQGACWTAHESRPNRPATETAILVGEHGPDANGAGVRVELVADEVNNSLDGEVLFRPLAIAMSTGISFRRAAFT